VGGQVFETSLTTLRRDPNSMLASMFGGNRKEMESNSIHIFIFIHRIKRTCS
jgi:hypothetical protein